jgi:hypothetical protein
MVPGLESHWSDLIPLLGGFYVCSISRTRNRTRINSAQTSHLIAPHLETGDHFNRAEPSSCYY